ncbi:MAG TPA: alanine racemase [Patescibacteria group bacterium]|nr:alanine racemase [Patescibacteria group bacterium]
MIIDSLKAYKKPKYETLNIIEIQKNNLLHNLKILEGERPNSQIIPVLKANAYGHGLKELCQIIKNKVKTVAVDSFPEAQIAYKYFKGRVLIMGEMPLKAYTYTKLNKTEFYVYNYKTLRHIATKFGQKAKVHLFVNTGMNREGIKDLPKFIEDNSFYLNKVQVVGLASHLASAETLSKFNDTQEENFAQALEFMQKNGYKGLKTHLGNSAGVFTLKREYSAYRAGIGFYGYNIIDPQHNKYEIAKQLKPALKVYSQIISLQKIKAQEIVSYNENFSSEKDSTIAVIPFGYSEGLPRHLSNQGKLKIMSKDKPFFAQISGNVCMNLTCVDLGDNKAQIGDRVQVVSSLNSDANSFANIADLADTIIYEPLIRLAVNIRRKVV